MNSISKQTNWYQKGVNEVYDVLYNEIDNNNERFDFLKHLIQNYPELEIDWLEIFEDLKETLLKEEKIEEVLFFVEWYSHKFEEEYKSKYAFIERDLCDYFLFKKDDTALQPRIDFIQQNPAEGIDVVTKRLFFQLIYSGKYEQAVSFAERVWEPLDQDERLMGSPALDFVNAIYVNNLQQYYEAILRKQSYNTINLFKKAVALGFEDDTSVFNKIMYVIQTDFDRKFIDSSIENEEDEHMLYLNIQFLKYMYDEYKLPFVFSELVWKFIGVEEIFGHYGMENWFYIDAQTMDKHIIDSYGSFLGNKELEVFGRVYGLQYLTSFFYSKNLINENQFQIMSENNVFFRNRLLKTVGVNAWQMLFVLDWPTVTNNTLSEWDSTQLEKTFYSTLPSGKTEFDEYISSFSSNDRIIKEIAVNNKRKSLFSMEPSVPYIKEKKEVGRNEPCPCGSGKKYKKCCLNK